MVNAVTCVVMTPKSAGPLTKLALTDNGLEINSLFLSPCHLNGLCCLPVVNHGQKKKDICVIGLNFEGAVREVRKEEMSLLSHTSTSKCGGV